jgi:hypothetical protein
LLGHEALLFSFSSSVTIIAVFVFLGLRVRDVENSERFWLEVLLGWAPTVGSVHVVRTSTRVSFSINLIAVFRLIIENATRPVGIAPL